MAIKTRKHLHPWWVAEVLNPCDRQPLQTWAETMSPVSWRESELLLTQNLPSFIEVQRLGEAATKKNDPQSKRKKSAADPMLIGVDLLAFSTLLATLAIYKPRTVRVLWSLTGAWKISLGFVHGSSLQRSGQLVPWLLSTMLPLRSLAAVFEENPL